MGFTCKSMAAAAVLAFLAGCGGPPDDVAEAARQSRAQTKEREAAATPQRTDTAQRSAPAAEARPAPPALPDRSTAAMGAGPAPADAAATAAQSAASAVRAGEDARITSRVRGALDADREVGPLRLDVDTRDGVVTLSGTVPTAAARARAGDLAKSVKDVKSLNDQLTLSTG